MNFNFEAFFFFEGKYFANYDLCWNVMKLLVLLLGYFW
jgi:hypothetical protein